MESRELHNVPVSETVVYQYREIKGKRTDEQLVASGKYYPGVLINNKFYYGLHKNGRFLPGIIWNERFIPGLLTRHSFFPGIVTKHGFQPGIIGLGAFVPGVVIGSAFVPGLMRDGHFLPGCFTNQGKFALGRFLRGQFDSGVIDARTKIFIPTNYELLSTEPAFALITEGYGANKIRRYEPVGGIPIAGMVKGVFDSRVWIFPSGFISNKCCVIGGLSFDQKNLPHVDVESELEQLGFDTSVVDMEGLASGQNELEGKLNDMLGSTPGSIFGAGADDTQIIEGLNELSGGSSELIDSINSQYNDYWKGLENETKSSGMISDGNGSEGAGGGKGNETDDNNKKETSNSRIGDMVIAGIISNAIRYIFDAAAKSMSTTAGGSCPILIPTEMLNNWKYGGKGGGTTAPSDSDGGGANNVTVGGWAGPRPIEVKNPNERTSGIKIVHTDTGAMVIVDYDQLSDAMAMGPGGIAIGLNPLTGEVERIIPGAVDPKLRVRDAMLKMFHDPIINPEKVVSVLS